MQFAGPLDIIRGIAGIKTYEQRCPYKDKNKMLKKLFQSAGFRALISRQIIQFSANSLAEISGNDPDRISISAEIKLMTIKRYLFIKLMKIFSQRTWSGYPGHTQLLHERTVHYI